MDSNYTFDYLSSLSDEKLALLSQTGNSMSFDILLERYRAFVRSKSFSYFIAGAEKDDIIQEGMIGLFKAVRDFSPAREASFKTFAVLCITRQILTAVKNASRKKHSPLNSYVSLNSSDSDDDDNPFSAGIVSNGNLNPEDIVIGKEDADILYSKLSDSLSKFELSVLSHYLAGMSYEKIASALNKDAKSVDNALSRIKRKFEKYFSN